MESEAASSSCATSPTAASRHRSAFAWNDSITKSDSAPIATSWCKLGWSTSGLSEHELVMDVCRSPSGESTCSMTIHPRS